MAVKTILLEWSEVEPAAYDEISIVGGGPSFKPYLGKQVPGYVIGANKCAFGYPCDHLFSLDRNFIKHFHNDIQIFKQRIGGVTLGVTPSQKEQIDVIEGVQYLRWERGEGITQKRNSIMGHHSGLGAINLAFHMRPKVIHLFGFDMRHGDGTHWHSGYANHGTPQARYMAKWALSMPKVAAELDKAEIKVVHWVGEPDSIITAFKRRSLDEL